MNQEEHDYFVWHAQRDTQDRKYFDLYLKIRNQKKYDEGALVEQFGKNGFSELKRRLRKRIAQLIARLEGDFEESTQDGIREIQVYIGKQLFKPALKLLNSLYKKVEENEEFLEQLQLLELKRIILFHLVDSKKYEINLKELDGFYENTLEALSNLSALKRLRRWEFSISRKKNYARGEIDSQKAKDLLQNPLLNENAIPKSKKAIVEAVYLKSELHHFLRNFTEAKLGNQRLMEVFASNPFLEKEYSREWVKCHFNYYGYLFLENKFEAARSILYKLKEKFAEKKAIKEEFWYNYYIFWVLFIEKTKDKKAFEDLQGEIDTFLESKQLEKYDLHYYNFHFFYSKAMFELGKTKEMCQHLNLTIIANPKFEVKEDCQAFARILWIIGQFELGNYDLINQLIRSTKRFLGKVSGYQKLESIFFRRITSYNPHLSQSDTQKYYQEFLDEILNSVIGDDLKWASNFFDIPNWLKNKFAQPQ
ncbi:MAG: hypothetical protein H6581_06210 [Bacteroidia bacterium]|nr:hypothetical protein [Bacteroidia bacterium]